MDKITYEKFSEFLKEQYIRFDIEIINDIYNVIIKNNFLNSYTLMNIIDYSLLNSFKMYKLDSYLIIY